MSTARHRAEPDAPVRRSLFKLSTPKAAPEAEATPADRSTGPEQYVDGSPPRVPSGDGPAQWDEPI